MTAIFGWPFQVEISGDVRLGNAAAVYVQTSQAVDGTPLKHLHLCFTSFGELANRGGLGGTTIPLTQGCAHLTQEPLPLVRGLELVWRFRALAVDPRALAVLLNMIEGAELPIQRVQIVAPGPDVTSSLRVEEYPALSSAIPFRLRNQIASRNIDVEILFSQSLDPALLERVAGPLRAWRLVAILGGFRREELRPMESNFIPLTEPELLADQLSFSLEKNTAHDAAFDSLVNVLAWLAHTGIPVEEVSLD